MKVCTFWVGMFGFAILDLIWDNPDFEFFAYEQNKDTTKIIQESRRHPFFFGNISLHPQVQILTEYEKILPEMDILLLILPYQFLRAFIIQIQPLLKPGVLIVNLSKGINNSTLTTVSEDLSVILQDFPYSYAVLSGGMIASELVDGAPLGANIALSDSKDQSILQNLLHRKNLHIDFIDGSIRQIELMSALKNILALLVGYHEWKGLSASSIGYVLVRAYREIEHLLFHLGWSADLRFWMYATGGDIIATCFGNSRNRYLGRLVWEGMSPQSALEKLKNEKKTAEGYHTLLGLGALLANSPEYPLLLSLFHIFSD